jgi:preprotein translocase subunit SecB
MADPAPTARQIQLQRIYLKDCSLEVPLAPQVFTKPWNPNTDVQVGTGATVLGDSLYQVLLTITATAKLGEEVGFLAEVHQAGIFQISGFSEAEMPAILAAYCPNMLFPFAREAVASLVQRTGFPPLLLQPLNFDALFVEHQTRQRGEAEAKAAAKANDGGARLQ